MRMPERKYNDGPDRIRLSVTNETPRSGYNGTHFPPSHDMVRRRELGRFGALLTPPTESTPDSAIDGSSFVDLIPSGCPSRLLGSTNHSNLARDTVEGGLSPPITRTSPIRQSPANFQSAQLPIEPEIERDKHVIQHYNQ
jgi:hypothetical protein